MKNEGKYEKIQNKIIRFGFLRPNSEFLDYLKMKNKQLFIISK